MSRYDADDGDYVLIYDGENGLRMAPRSMAATLEEQEAGHLEMMAPDEADPAAGDGRARQLMAVIGVVAGLGVLGFLVGRDWGPPKAPQARPAMAVVAETAPVPATTVPTPSLGRAEPHRLAHSPRRPIEKRVVEKPAAHSRGPHKPAAPRKAARLGPVAACRPASTWAEWMVCHDSELSAQDSRLGQAMKAATAAGAPSQELQDGQTAWVARRNAAARRSRTEVSAAYRQRIEEVERLAKETPPF